jgi:hypothetical protein
LHNERDWFNKNKEKFISANVDLDRSVQKTNTIIINEPAETTNSNKGNQVGLS